MRYLKLLAVVGICLMAVPAAQAQRVVVGVNVGPAYVAQVPLCAYGYYPYSPYACAPYGYYGPSWFSGGVFIGAGPWHHGFYGRPGFYGHPGFYGRSGDYGRTGVVGHGGFVGRGPVARGQAGNGFRAGRDSHGGGRR
jgi:hypothetical protein